MVKDYWDMVHRCPECLSTDVSRDVIRGVPWNGLWACKSCHIRLPEKEFVKED